MGRVMPEARVLAEMTSLLSVARGELETFLNAVGIRQTESEDAAHRKEQDDVFDLMSDPMWMSGSREKAIALLRMCAAQVTPMRQYALVLQTNAERMGLSAVALDPLGITAERLSEAEELLRQPPTLGCALNGARLLASLRGGPDIGQVWRLCPAILPIELRVFAQQVRAMRGMECGITQPPGHRRGIWNLRQRHRVAVSPAHPLGDDHIHIQSQRIFVAAPHQRRWMPTPSAPLRLPQHPQELERFEPLLPQTAVIQACRRSLKVGIGQECLHENRSP